MIDSILCFIAEHPAGIIYAAGGSLLLLYVICLFRSSSSRNVLWDELPSIAPVNTWSDDFGAWKHGDITLDEFLDRRWAFRNLR